MFYNNTYYLEIYHHGEKFYYKYSDFYDKYEIFHIVGEMFLSTHNKQVVDKIIRNDKITFFLSVINNKISKREIIKLYKKFPKNSTFYHNDKEFIVSFITDNRYSSMKIVDVLDYEYYSIVPLTNSMQVSHFNVTDCISKSEMRFKKIKTLL